MRRCWKKDSEERPTFLQLSTIVERLLTSISGYTELGMVLLNTIQETEQLSKCIKLALMIGLVMIVLYIVLRY